MVWAQLGRFEKTPSARVESTGSAWILTVRARISRNAIPRLSFRASGHRRLVDALNGSIQHGVEFGIGLLGR
jgi:hypothetical protein